MSHRDDLLEGAKECLKTKGYARTTARDLVAASGTNLSSIGYHFGSKEALFAAAFDQLFDEWTEQQVAAGQADPQADPLTRMAASWRELLDGMPDRAPLLLAFVESIGPSVRSPELRARLAQHFDASRTRVAEVVAESLPEDSGADPRVVASFLMAVADGLMIQFLVDPENTPTGEELIGSLGAALAAAFTPPA
ncbi:MAG: TetR/AcrR family transcriptional regulator [Microvirga sp.]